MSQLASIKIKMGGAFLHFVVFFLTVWIIMHVYTWFHLVSATRLRMPWSWMISVGMASLGVGFIYAMTLQRQTLSSSWKPIFFLVFLWMGVLFLFTVSFILVDAGHLLFRMLNIGVATTRWYRIETLAVLGAVSALAIAGIISAFSPASVRHVTIQLKNLPDSLGGLSIVQLSDLHLGHLLGEQFSQRIVSTVNSLSPDLVVITGDLLDQPADTLTAALTPFKSLQAKHGTYFVTGNHDFYARYSEWKAQLVKFGISDLNNRRITIKSNGHSFELVGIHDPTGSRSGFPPSLETAMNGVSPNQLVILLAHQPQAIFESAKRVQLQLSGHTHGGQIWPFGLFAMLAQPFVSGLHKHGDCTLYVSRGTGFWGPPMRLFAPAEITFIRAVPDRSTSIGKR